MEIARVLRVPIAEAKAGMQLALPVANPKVPGHRLLLSGYALEDAVIARIKSMGIRDVWIRYPGLDALDQFIDPAVLERRAEMARKLEAAIGQVQKETVARLPYRQYMQDLSALIESLLTNPAAAILLDDSAAHENGMVQQSSTVCYLSLLIGMKMEGYLVRQRKRLPPHLAREVTSLGLGAMLHDIGLLKLPPEVLKKYRETGDQLDPEYRTHPELGYRLVRGEVSPTAAVVILHHHQHYDGSGFPDTVGPDGRVSRFSGESIHIFARIAAVAAEFAALRQSPTGEHIPAVRAIAQMLQPSRMRWFDPAVLRTFLACVPPYAPGTIIRLSDERWATPIDHNPDDPCRPIVQIIDDPEYLRDAAHDLGATMLDLRQHPQLHVAHADDTDVAEFNFTLANVPGEATRVPTLATIDRA